MVFTYFVPCVIIQFDFISFVAQITLALATRISSSGLLCSFAGLSSGLRAFFVFGLEHCFPFWLYKVFQAHPAHFLLQSRKRSFVSAALVPLLKRDVRSQDLGEGVLGAAGVLFLLLCPRKGVRQQRNCAYIPAFLYTCGCKYFCVHPVVWSLTC